MKRPLATWILFALCLALAVAALTHISQTLIELDLTQRRAQESAGVEEAVRLALWRMDSAMGPLLAQEANRPYFTYLPLYTERMAITLSPSKAALDDVRIVSPLVAQRLPFVRVHFQIDPEGQWTSPQTPEGEARVAIEKTGILLEGIQESTARLTHLKEALLGTAVTELLKPLDASSTLAAAMPTPTPSIPRQAEATQEHLPQAGKRYEAHLLDQQAEYSGQEFRQRRAQSLQNSLKLQSEMPQQPTPKDVGDIAQGEMHQHVIGSRLLLVRPVRINQRVWIQGCELDWPVLRKWLLDQVRDVLPEASLELVETASGAELSRAMASIPVRIIPNTVSPQFAKILPPSTVTTTLIAVWSALAVAATAAAILLAGALRLSERRATFVSAVTHELRTPLTTFRLYTEMLAEGRIEDKDKQQAYLTTLRSEAERLSHLVENVLALARLERRRIPMPREPVTVGSILDRTVERLDRRAQQADMTIVVEVPPEVHDAQVLAHPTSVEQILMNLVDNACKYAGSADDRRIHLTASLSDDTVQMRITDHGPGIPLRQARRLFRSFEKSTFEAAATAPGVGLGLAISRRLARAMGKSGDLIHQPSAQGTCMVLTLPRA